MNLPGHIGRYRVLDFLGKGAMGVVYRGRDEALERDVALKVMSLGHGADKEAHDRFVREARAAARLQHPNIITVYELGEHEGAPFMAMELLEGTDLQRAIEAGIRPNPKKTLPIVLQLLAGLGHAHESGIVHRDVKPSNVFLPRGRPAKIMDFGVARLAGGGTTSGGVVGTPNYMSPEQVRGGSLDGRSDLFSAGLILYELVTGEKAYKADSVVALMYKIAHEAANLSLIPRGADWERLRQVLARSLAHVLDERYAHARAMADELALALQDLGGTADWAAPSDIGVVVRTTPRPSAVVTEAPKPLVVPQPAAQAAPVPAAPARLGETQRTPLVVAAGLVGAAIVLLAIAVVVLMRSRGAAPPARTPSTTVAAASLTRPASAPAPAPAKPAPAPRATPTVVPATVPTAAPTARPPSEPSPDETAIPAGPPPENARLDRANELLERGRYAAAIAEAKAVLRREPRNEEARTLVEDAEAALVVETRIKEAREALKKGDKDTALEAIKKGLAVNKSDARLIALFREATQ